MSETELLILVSLTIHRSAGWVLLLSSESYWCSCSLHAQHAYGSTPYT